MTIADMASQVGYILSNLAEEYSPVNQNNQPVICSVYVFLRGSFLNISSLMTMLISFERMIAVYFPFRYKDGVKVPLMAKIGFVCVVVSLLHSGMSKYIFRSSAGQCLSTRVHTAWVIFAGATAVAFVLLPSVTTAVLNICLIIKVRNRSQRLALIIKFCFTMKKKTGHLFKPQSVYRFGVISFQKISGP